MLSVNLGFNREHDSKLPISMRQSLGVHSIYQEGVSDISAASRSPRLLARERCERARGLSSRGPLICKDRDKNLVA